MSARRGAGAPDVARTGAVPGAPVPRGPGARPPVPPAGARPGGGGGTDRRALLRLAAGTAAVVGLFLGFGRGDLLLFIVAILVIVMLHELGHFATAKWSGMKVTEYFVGFGPRLWSVRKGETEYGVKAVPAGGYVKIPGMTNLDKVDPADEPRTYRQRPFHQRILVACAGSGMHFLIAFVLAWSAILAFGAPTSSAVRIAGFVHWPGHATNAAQAAGLHAGDTVLAVDGKAVTTAEQFSSIVRRSPGRPLHLMIQRDGHGLVLTVTPVAGHLLPDGSETIGPGPGPAIGIIGISSSVDPVLTPEGPFRAVGTAAVQVARTTSATVAGLGHVFSPHGLGSFVHQVTDSQAAAKAAANPAQSDRVMSLVGAGRIAVQAEHKGVLYFIDVLIALNIVIALVNMLPMLPLDGGHVAIALYERLRTRRGGPSYRADAAKLLPVAYAFMAVLLVVVLSAAFLDIAHPVSLH
ncbi:MAG TPA: site-2 protease family protein [Acidimicrobiales bacterium]|nr:site-2 protease family protein [Acidimicrobiales bacterium]